MRRQLPLVVALTAAATIVFGCASPGSSTAPTTAGGTTGPTTAAEATVIPGGLLDKIKKAGKIVVSTDPAYPPQSEQVNGVFQGFDIDVATEVAKRLGVTVEWQTPEWTAITAGSWGGRWDMSVGSMTITPDRAKVLDFSPPYYYTPAQMAASTHSGVTTIDGLTGKTVCAGDGTTYYQWLTGTLDFGPGGKPAPPPAGITATTLPSDRDCAVQWQQGRFDFDGWLSSITTVEGAIKDGLPLVKVGDPVYLEPLAIAVDKSGPNDADFIAWLKPTIEAMRADGTLKAFSQKWFKADFTTSTQ